MKNRSCWEIWRLSFRHRPFLWLAPLAACGCASGAHWALALAGHDPSLTRSAPFFVLPLLLAILCLWLSLRSSRRQPVMARAFLAIGLASVLCFFATQKVLPPPGDVSFLTNPASPPPAGPIVPVSMKIKGWIADFPERGEFNTQFPLECDEAQYHGQNKVRVQGRVWLRVPPAVKIEVDDHIEATVDLTALPRAGNLGERETRLRFIERGCWSLGRVRDAASIKVLPAPPRFLLLRRIARLREKLRDHYYDGFAKLHEPYPRARAQLLTAMAFGEGGLDEALPRLTRDEFRAAGMSHVLVASGTQVSMIVLMILGAARVLGARRWPLFLVLIPILFCYALLAGNAASIWRATIAGLCLACAITQGRDVDGLSLWCLAFIALLFIDPLQLFSLSYQLSFAATWGLIVAGPVLRQLFIRAFGQHWLSDGAAFSMAAQAGVAPLAAYHFGTFSLSGLGANLLGVPVAGLLIGTALLDWLLPFTAIHYLNYYLTSTLSSVAHVAAIAPGAQFEAMPLRLLWTALIYGMLAVALFFAAQSGSLYDHLWIPLKDEWRRWRARQHFHRSARNAILLVLLGVTLWLALHIFDSRQQQLVATLLDVGQGESIYVRSPAGRTVLIDGGTESTAERGDVGGTVIVPFLQSQGVQRLDALVITHADADHCNGLLAVVREVPIGLVLDGAQQGDVMATEYLLLCQELARRKIPRVRAHPGQLLNLGGGARMRMLAPQMPKFHGANADNNNAAVMKLEYGKTSILLTADIEREAEERLVRRGADLDCTILKVAHHGSATSTQEMFLRAAHPQAAIISCGRYNRFGHPRAEVLRRLWQRKIATFRTDVNGAIEMSCDGKDCWIQTQR
jgi:competence protein ComEC